MPWVDPPETTTFTQITVTGRYLSQGVPGAGTVTFTLTAPIRNGDVIALAEPMIVTLDSNGEFSVPLYATDDPGTVPQGVWYGVTEQVTGSQPRDYFIQVLSEYDSPVQLSSLTPGNTGWQ